MRYIYIWSAYIFFIKVYSIIFTLFSHSKSLRTLVFTCLTHPPSKTRRTEAGKHVDTIPAWTAMVTRVARTLIYVCVKKKEKWPINNNNWNRIQMMMMTLTFRKTDIFKEKYHIPTNLYNSWKFVIKIRKYTSYIN